MKKSVAIFCGAFVICGCRQNKYETQEMTWYGDISTNMHLIVSGKDGVLETNVDSLDQAANIVGQYGWEFVNSDVENGDQVYHMKRRIPKDAMYGTFSLTANITEPSSK
jgi:hypothetical protein